jgi:nuclease A inhibitor-like protein
MSRDELEKLTEGLLYMSKTDAPLKYFELDEEAARQWPPTTATQFLELIGEEPKTPAQEVPPEKFFEALLEGNVDNEGQVDILRMAAMAKLENVRCYRVGEIEVEIYCVHSGIKLDLDYSQA